MAWLLPDTATRLGRLTRMFATIIGIESLPYGGVDIACAGEETLGGAIWMPPGHWQPGLLGKIRAAPRHSRAVATAEIRATRMGHALSRAHPKEPHWYLKSIGIGPSRQGRGAAGLLLRSRLEYCDRDGQSTSAPTTPAPSASESASSTAPSSTSAPVTSASS